MATRSVQPECYLNTHVGSVEGTVLVAKLSVGLGRTNSTAFEILRRPGRVSRLKGLLRQKKLNFATLLFDEVCMSITLLELACSMIHTLKDGATERRSRKNLCDPAAHHLHAP